MNNFIRSEFKNESSSIIRRLIRATLFVCLIALVSAVSSGCIAIRKDLVPMAEPVKPLPVGVSAVPVTVQYIYEGRVGDTVGTLTENTTGPFGVDHRAWVLYRQRFDEVAKTAGLFTVVGSAEDKQKVNFRIIEKQHISFMGAFATQLSMIGLIPSWPDVYLEVMAFVQTPEGKTFSYDIKDGLVQINFLPLIIVAPFKPATSDYNEVVRNLYRTLFHKMQDDGVLPREIPMASSNITDVPKSQAEKTLQQANKNL